MSKSTKHVLLYVALLLVTHTAALAFSHSHALKSLLGYQVHSSLRWVVVFIPVMVVPLIFGLMVRSWRQFATYLLITIVVWQVSFIVDDWLARRSIDPAYLIESGDSWVVATFRRCIIPVALICVGALMGKLKRTPRLP